MTSEHLPAAGHDGDVAEVPLLPQGVHVPQRGVAVAGQAETHHVHLRVFERQSYHITLRSQSPTPLP